MKCEESDTHLLDLIHDELDAPVRAEVLRHLAGCPACALRYCQLRADLEGVSMSAEAPPPILRRKVRRAVELAFRPPWWRRAVDVWRRPIPAYGIVVASVAPVVAWAAISFGPAVLGDPPAPAPTPAPSPRIIDYDAMVPLTPHDVLL